MVGDYEVPKQPLCQFEFYEVDPAIVVVVDPLSTKENSYLVFVVLELENMTIGILPMSIGLKK